MLAPELWREGLLASDADFVAFTTARMIPSRGWLEALKARLVESESAGVGGPIEPGAGLSTTDRAVALLRYASYFPGGSLQVDPPGDNALYRRDRLMEVGSSWVDGFWEVDVHRALRARGETLAMAGSAVVTFVGGVGLGSMMVQRFRHARRYGRGRSVGLGVIPRASRVAAAPVVPALLCVRIARALRSRGMALGPWLTAVPALLLLAASWAIGEAVGTCQGESSWAGDLPRQPLAQPSRKAG